jgi:MazG family protein
MTARDRARATRAATAMARLVRIMTTLRSPRGCPWDRKQTHRSLRPFLLEETYEALDALDRRDHASLPGELGDVLFQVVFHAQIASEAGRWEMADALTAIGDKLIRRHPHVFTASGRPLPRTRRRKGAPGTPSAVLTQWEQLKAAEQKNRGERRRVLAGVPNALPALLRAHEIGTRVAAVGFDWPDTAGVVDKVEEEVRELREAINESPARAAEEFGDLLFSLANLARKLNIEPEAALREANDKFSKRFAAVEHTLEARGLSVHRATTEDMEAAWQQVKREPKARSSGSAGAARKRRAPAPRARRSR